MRTTVLERTSLSQRAADAVMADVAANRWEIGQQLPGEVALADELGVGRSTVREAIRLLVERGVLSTRHGVGVFLEATSETVPWDRMAQGAEIDEVLQVRIAIESRAAALAANRRTDADLRRIRKALAERNSLSGDGDAPAPLVAADVAFHRAVVDASGNALLSSLFDSIQNRVADAMTDLVANAGLTASDVDEHSAVVEALANGDGDDAERLTREHLLALGRLATRRSRH